MGSVRCRSKSRRVRFLSYEIRRSRSTTTHFDVGVLLRSSDARVQRHQHVRLGEVRGDAALAGVEYSYGTARKSLGHAGCTPSK